MTPLQDNQHVAPLPGEREHGSQLFFFPWTDGPFFVAEDGDVAGHVPGDRAAAVGRPAGGRALHGPRLHGSERAAHVAGLEAAGG